MNTTFAKQQESMSAVGPKTAKLKKHKELVIEFENLLNAFHLADLNKTDKDKQKELQRKILTVFTNKEYSLEKITQIMSVLLLRYETLQDINAQALERAVTARSTFKDIVGLEASIDPGGRPSHLFSISVEICKDYLKTHEGKLPKLAMLTKLGNKKLNEKLNEYLDMNDVSRKKLTVSERKFMQALIEKKEKAEEGIELFSSRTASEHLQLIRATQQN